MNFDTLRAYMDRLAENIVPGNSIVVYKDTKKVFEYSSGYSDLENHIKKTGDELINIYSASKVATAVAAMQLYEQGFFLLSDPLSEYLPEFLHMNIKTDRGIVPATKPITIRDLFCMSAGFDYDLNSPAMQKAHRITGGRMDTRTVMKCLSEAPLEFEPGERWRYSLCHDVLACLVEVVSGKRFSEYMRDNIFLPLEMNKSCYHGCGEVSPQYIYDTGDSTDMVELQRHGARGGSVVRRDGNMFILGEDYDSGGAGIISKVDDYVKLGIALANKGVGQNGNRIISEASIELMKINQLSEAQMKHMNWSQLNGYGYGLGFRTLIDKAKSGSLGNIGEFGWNGAAGASILMDTKENLAMFYAHHMLNPQEEYYQPRLRNVLYACLR